MPKLESVKGHYDDLGTKGVKSNKKVQSKGSLETSKDVEVDRSTFEKIMVLMTGGLWGSNPSPKYEIQAPDLLNLSKRRASTASTASELSYKDSTGILENLKTFIASRKHSGQGTEWLKNNSEELISEGFLPAKLNGELPEPLIAKAERELGETPERRKQALKELRQMIKEEGKDFKTDEDILLMFLRAKKFDVKKAFKSMEKLAIYKKSHYDLHPFDPVNLKTELDSDVGMILRYRDQHGRIMVLGKAANIVAGRTDANEILTMAISCLAKSLEDPANQIAGFASIIDCANQSYKCLKYASFNNAKLMKMVYLESMPVRYQALHVINPNFFFKLGFRLSELFVSKKLRERVFVHGSLKSLHKHVPPAILPPELGGTLKNWKYNLTLEDFQNPKLLS